MDAYTIGWLGWIAWFCVEEGLALAKGGSAGSKATLSGHLWWWFAIKDKHAPYRKVRHTLLIAGLAWLSMHLLTGGWT